MPNRIVSLLLEPPLSPSTSDSMLPCSRSSEDWQSAAVRSILGIGMFIAVPRLLQAGRRYHIGETSQVLLALLPRGLFNAPNLRSLWENRGNPRAINRINDLRSANLLTQENFNQVIQNLGNDLFLTQITLLRDEGILTQSSFNLLSSLAANPHFLNAITLLNENELLTRHRFNSLAIHASTPRFLEAIPLLAQNRLLTEGIFEALIAQSSNSRFLEAIPLLAQNQLLTEGTFEALIAQSSNPLFLEAIPLLAQNQLLTEGIFEALIAQSSNPLFLEAIHILAQNRLLTEGTFEALKAQSSNPPFLEAIGLLAQNGLLTSVGFHALMDQAGNPLFLETVPLLAQNQLLRPNHFNSLVTHGANAQFLNTIWELNRTELLIPENRDDLMRLVDYFYSIDPQLLEGRTNHLIENRRYADRILRGTRILHDAGLSQSRYFRLLIEHPEYGESLAIAIRLLHRKRLLECGFENLTAHPMAIHRLQSAGLLNLHLPLVLRRREQTEALTDAICRLHEAGIPNALLPRLIPHLLTSPGSPFPVILERVHDLVAHAEEIRSGMLYLEQNRLLPSYLRLLIEAPLFAEDLARGIAILEKEELLDHLECLTENPQHVSSLINGISILKESGLLDWYGETLFKHPEYAENLAIAIKMLKGKGLIPPNKNLDTLLRFPQFAIGLANAIRILHESLRSRSISDSLSLHMYSSVTPNFKVFSALLKLKDPTDLGDPTNSRDRVDLRDQVELLLQNPEHAEPLARGIQILHRLNLMRSRLKALPKYVAAEDPDGKTRLGQISNISNLATRSFKALIQHPQHAERIARGVEILETRHLLEEHIELLLQHPQFAESLAFVASVDANLLSKYLQILLQHPEDSCTLDRQVRQLLQASSTTLRDWAQIDYLLDLLPHERAIVRLMPALFDKRERLDEIRAILSRHPAHAELLVREMSRLQDRNLLEAHLNTLSQHPEIASDVATLILDCDVDPNLNDLIDILARYPKYSASLTDAIRTLYARNRRLLSPEYLQILTQHPEDAPSRASLILFLFERNLLNSHHHELLLECSASNLNQTKITLSRLAQSGSTEHLKLFFYFLMKNPNYANELEEAIEIVYKSRRHLRLEDCIIKLCSENRARVMNLIAFARMNPGVPITQQIIDQIIEEADHRGAPPELVDQLNRWQPLASPLPGALIQNVLSFLYPQKEKK